MNNIEEEFQPENSFWTNKVVEKEALTHYDLLLSNLKAETYQKKMTTSLGTSNVLITGDNNKPPLILLHGLNSCAPLALQRLEFLMEKYCVYAIDLLGEPNKSDQVRLNKKNDDWGIWLHEMLDKLELEKVTVLGMSFGGFVGLKALLVNQSRIKSIYLISTAGIINGNPFKFLFGFYLPFLSFQKSQKEEKLQKCYHSLFTDEHGLVKKYLKLVFLHFKADQTITPLFKLTDFKEVKTPIYCISSAEDILFPGVKLNKRAEKLFPNYRKGLVLKKAKHVFGNEQEKEVKNFFRIAD